MASISKSKSPPTITLEHDDLIRRYKILSEENRDTKEKFLAYMEAVRLYCARFKGVEQELSRLQTELVKSKEESRSFQFKLKNARKLIEMEKGKRLAAEKEKWDLEKQISLVMQMLGQGNIDETKERLQILSSTLSGGQGGDRLSIKDGVLSPNNHLSTINEDADTLGSILNVSDIDLTDGDELEESHTRSGRSFRSSSPHSRSGQKRKSSPCKGRDSDRKNARSEDKENIAGSVGKMFLENVVRGHSKVGECTPSAPPLSSDENCEVEGKSLTSFRGTLSNFESPIRHYQQNPPRPQVQVYTPMGSTLYRSPGNSPLVRSHSNGKVNGRQHYFTSKTIYWTDFCQPCEKRIKFGKSAYKCRDCRATCHIECKDAVPLPCVPIASTPGAKGINIGSIADFAPRVPPMVPALIVHCTNEVESRGLCEVGIYRVPGSEREVKELKERFLKAKGVPNLNSIDIHVVCCTLKSFLRSLKEPLVPSTLWRDFVSAAEKQETQDALAVLYQAISDLPQPNRDTLAWVICHLQKVAECAECKMPSTNLARVFGPTLVGYSVADLKPLEIIEETRLQQKVLELLMEISTDYWQSYLSVDDEFSSPDRVGHAPPEISCPASNTRRKSFLSFAPLPPRDAETPRRGSKK